ncbi:MAG: antibiotic biosynthesis monooxygenase [Flavobacteriaceae bacterium]|nr:antibiotic biosynthesis monooxygenase [Flavobacteriaceae bacterium]
MKKLCLISALLITLASCGPKDQANTTVDYDNMIVRIAELEIAEEQLENYLSELNIEARVSMAEESGVISIFPLSHKETPTKITIVEIYANQSAYEAHLETPHFKKYKTITAEMVKSLKLIDMSAVDLETMPLIFEKLN